MGYTEWVNAKVQKLDGFDVSLAKLSTAAFVLMLVKFWPVIASLEWYWYAILFIVFAIRPIAHTLK